VEHAGKFCSNIDSGDRQSGISTVEACKQACTHDADCKYANWYSSLSRCYFSSECSFHSHSRYTMYV